MSGVKPLPSAVLLYNESVILCTNDVPLNVETTGPPCGADTGGSSSFYEQREPAVGAVSFGHIAVGY